MSRILCWNILLRNQTSSSYQIFILFRVRLQDFKQSFNLHYRRLRSLFLSAILNRPCSKITNFARGLGSNVLIGDVFYCLGFFQFWYTPELLYLLINPLLPLVQMTREKAWSWQMNFLMHSRMIPVFTAYWFDPPLRE